jgi:hypothetical protein
VLDNVRIEYSYRHPTLVTLTVDAFKSSAPQSDTQEWRLPTFDPKNENKYLYKLHTVDIYLWTKEDAELFMNTVHHVLPENQFSISGEPPAPEAHAEAMSPVVQQLENVAITDHSYEASQQRTQSTSSGHSFPGPPAAPASVPVASLEPAAFAPMAYNPAAPAAPETIRHREKTPPPDDGVANPLVAAAAHDQGQYAPQYAPQPGLSRTSTGLVSPQASYFPGPPKAAVGGAYAPGALPPPPAGPSPGPQPGMLQHTATFGSGYPQHVQYAQHTASPGFQQPLASPGFQQPLASPGFQQPLASPGFAPPPQYSGSMPAAQQTPLGGYSGYSYAQNTAPVQGDYSIHQQIYRPAEGEIRVKPPKAKENKGKLEENAARLEKGVTGFLKKIEKRYG